MLNLWSVCYSAFFQSPSINKTMDGLIAWVMTDSVQKAPTSSTSPSTSIPLHKMPLRGLRLARHVQNRMKKASRDSHSEVVRKKRVLHNSHSMFVWCDIFSRSNVDACACGPRTPTPSREAAWRPWGVGESAS